MPDMDISMERMARDAVRVRFDPGGGQGTAEFVIDLAREVGGKVDDVDRWKVLLKAQSIASNFIDCVNREIHAHAHRA